MKEIIHTLDDIDIVQRINEGEYYDRKYQKTRTGM